MKSIVFYFTGTGNSLKIAKAVSNETGNGEIIPMGANQGITISHEYDRIGFIYPVYFWAIPKAVRKFVANLKIENNANAYFYAVASYGGLAGNGIKLLHKMLLEKNITLKYGKTVRIFSNYIINFTMPNNSEKILAKSDKKLAKIIDAIKNKKTNAIGKPHKTVNNFYEKSIGLIASWDEYYTINDKCIGCGICKAVCPVNNIEIKNGKPAFKHTCEQCMACIQYCPEAAINYKDKTQKKKRYTNPSISYKELARMNALKYNEPVSEPDRF
jgi:ferredoxin